MNIQFEADAIVVMVGAMGTGKSTFLKRIMLKHQIVSTDELREQLCGDFKNQSVSGTMFEILDATLTARAKAGLFTVVDSTGTQRVLDKARELAKKYNRKLYALRFPPVPENELTQERMQHRMSVLSNYRNQVVRINRTVFPKEFVVIDIPIEGRDDIKLVVTDSVHRQTNDLSPQYRYLVVPDLHGEYWVFDEIEERLAAEPDLRVIQLGDIVDRGESSYKTFRRVYSLWNRGLLVAVPGNHDNKLYRWMKKYLAADNRDVGFVEGSFPTFGMSVSNGLGNTLEELAGFTPESRWQYAKDWCWFYEAMPLYLRLERNGIMNFFVHAGITPEMLSGWAPSKRDISYALYNALLTPQAVRAATVGVFGEALHKGDIRGITVHVGHTFGYVHQYERATAEDDGPYRLFSHDIGLGKRQVLEQPNFVVV